MNPPIQTEDFSHSGAWPIIAGLVKIFPIAHLIGAVLCCAVGWYVATQTNSYTENSRLDALEKRADGAERSLDKVLTKEVYEAYRKGDIERADRMEKMLMQLLEQKK